MASKKLSKLKKVAREYHRHPAGAPGSKGGQFAPKNKSGSESIESRLEDAKKTFEVKGGNIILSSGKQVVPNKRLKDGKIELTKDQLKALKKQIIDAPPVPVSTQTPRSALTSKAKATTPSTRVNAYRSGLLPLLTSKAKATTPSTKAASTAKTAAKTKINVGAKGTIIAGRELPDGFPANGFSSTKDADEWLSNRFPSVGKNGFNLSGTHERTNKSEVNPLKKGVTLDPEMATLAALTITKLADDFPDVMTNFKGFNANEFVDTPGIARGIRPGKQGPILYTINLGSSELRDKKSNKAMSQRILKSGHAVFSDKLYAIENIIIHEFGHCIDYVSSGEKGPEAMASRNPTFQDPTSAKKLSLYAATKPVEAFAEAFLAYYTGQKSTHPMVQEVARVAGGIRRKK